MNMLENITVTLFLLFALAIYTVLGGFDFWVAVINLFNSIFNQPPAFVVARDSFWAWAGLAVNALTIGSLAHACCEADKSSNKMRERAEDE